MHEHTGPGTPAWNAFDRALNRYAEAYAWQVRHSGSISKAPTYKSYHNQRAYMVRSLRAAGLTELQVKAWVNELNFRIKQKDFELSSPQTTNGSYPMKPPSTHQRMDQHSLRSGDYP